MAMFVPGSKAEIPTLQKLRLSVTESQFFEQVHIDKSLQAGLFEDLQDNSALFSKPLTLQKVTEVAKRIDEYCSKALCKFFPNLHSNLFRLCIPRHMIPRAFTVPPRVINKALLPIPSSISEHNQRIVNGSVEQKLEREFQDAQCHVNLGFNANWNRIMIDQELEIEAQVFPKLNAAVASAQGKRKFMEDTQLVTSLEIGDKSVSIPLYGIFDGHHTNKEVLGDRCAQYLKRYLAGHLKSGFEKVFKQFPHQGEGRTNGIFNILKMACAHLGRSYWQSETGRPEIPGSTAVFAVIIDDCLWVANVGDSRAILCVDDDAIALSQDAEPCIDKYQRGIEKRGGMITFFDGALRTNDGVAMARAVGHDEQISGVNPRAKIIRYKLDELKKNADLVIASDGLWDMVSSAQVAESLGLLDMERYTIVQKANDLVNRAYSCGSGDNISAIVVNINPIVIN